MGTDARRWKFYGAKPGGITYYQGDTVPPENLWVVPEDDAERARLEGYYEALAWVTTSPAIPKSVIKRIEAEARSLIPRLEELGAKFHD